MPALPTFDEVYFWASLAPIILPLILIALSSMQKFACKVTAYLCRLFGKQIFPGIFTYAQLLIAVSSLLCMVEKLRTAVRVITQLALTWRWILTVVQCTCSSLIGVVGLGLLGAFAIEELRPSTCEFIKCLTSCSHDFDHRLTATDIGSSSSKGPSCPLPRFTIIDDPSPHQLRLAIVEEGVTVHNLVAQFEDYATQNMLRFALLVLREGRYEYLDLWHQARIVPRIPGKSPEDQALLDEFLIKDIVVAARAKSNRLPVGYCQLLHDEKHCQYCEHEAGQTETFEMPSANDESSEYDASSEADTPASEEGSQDDCLGETY
jgi:hypothetical protein